MTHSRVVVVFFRPKGRSLTGRNGICMVESTRASKVLESLLVSRPQYAPSVIRDGSAVPCTVLGD